MPNKMFFERLRSSPPPKSGQFKTAFLTGWTAYGIVETWAATVVQPSRQPVAVSLAFLAGYAVFGYLLGACLDLVSRRPPSASTARNTSALTIVVVFLLNILTAPGFGTYSKAGVAVLALMVLAAAITGIAFPRVRAVAMLTNPWTTAALLLMPICLMHDVLYRLSRPVQIGIVAAAIAVTLGLSALMVYVEPTRLHHFGFGVAVVFTLAAVVMARGTDASPSTMTPHRSQPNIILIVMDTVRSDHTSAFGYDRDTTPFLRTFPATRFPRAYATSNITLTSTASVFTGLLPSAHGAYATAAQPIGASLSPRFRTIGELLSSRGYETIGVAANTVYLSPRFGFDQGLEEYECRSRSAYLVRETVLAELQGAPRTDYLRASEINADVLRYLGSRKSQKPLFLFVNYMDAHAPYSAAPWALRQFAAHGETTVAGALMEDAGERVLSPHEIVTLKEQYDASIATIDEAIRHLLGSVKKVTGNDALVIITSDHGEAFGDHEIFGHGKSVYDEQIHVPLLIHEPGQTQPRVSERPTSLAELFNVVDEASGNSRSRTLLENKPPQSVIAEGFWLRSRALIDQDRKLIMSQDGVELYDLTNDRGELTNLAPQSKDLVARLTAQLHAGLPKATNGDPAAIDQDMRARLRSLGYLSP